MSYRDLADAELHALAFVDERELVRDLVELVEVPSVSGSAAESDIQHRLAKQLRQLDLDLDLWQLDLPSLRADPGFPGWEVERSESWGLVAGPPTAALSPAGVPRTAYSGYVRHGQRLLGVELHAERPGETASFYAWLLGPGSGRETSSWQPVHLLFEHAVSGIHAVRPDGPLLFDAGRAALTARRVHRPLPLPGSHHQS